MAIQLLLGVLLWTLAPTLVNASGFNLSNDTTQFIPSCAIDCLQSFLEANFAADLCSTSPSLQCLCAHTGSSGFTIGEGAVQCIVAEENVGACGSDVGSNAVVVAYEMCSGIKNAAPETHATIVATLIVPSGTPGPVGIPAPETTTSSSRTTTATMPASAVSMTISVPSSSALPSSTLSTSVKSSASVSPTATSTSAASGPSLTPVQIAGVSVGAVGAIALAIGAVICARCVRRKRFGEEQSGFSKMRESWSCTGQPGGENSHILQISAPIHHQRQEMDYSRALEIQSQVHPGAIGVALSPDKPSPAKLSAQWQPGLGVIEPLHPLRTPPAQIHTSPMASPYSLPSQAGTPRVKEAEVSPLRVPRGQPRPAENRTQEAERAESPPKPVLTLSIPQGSAKVASNRRTRTPFSGRESIVTEFAEDGEESATAAIWRPPPSDPQSATTYYVADRWGNWVLNTQAEKSRIVAAEGAIPPKSQAAGGGGAARTPPVMSTRQAPVTMPAQPAPAALAPPINLKKAGQSAASGVYPGFVAYRPGVPGTEATQPTQPANAPERVDKPGRPTGGKRLYRKSRGPERSTSVLSNGSTTTIDDSEEEDEDEGETMAKELSPLVESPGSGKSPVTYPRIKGRERASPLKLFPSPPRAGWSRTPPGQQNTIREPAKGNPPRYPTSNAPAEPRYPGQPHQPTRMLNPTPNPNRSPAMVRTGSPNMEAIASGSMANATRPGPVLEQQHQQSRLPIATNLPQGQNNPSYPPYAVAISPATPASFSSAGSSLLAKRLGAERAAALTLGGRGGDPGSSRRGNKWQRHQSTKGAAAAVMYMETMDQESLPLTPGCEPKLTPKRKGDDLYLSVQ